ncbi:MAG: BspA family leucine-rich repeat surface protein [Allomuricauda sp.]|jgi:surface protein
MKKTICKIGITLMTIAFLWSCSKDDRAASTLNAEPTNSAPIIKAQYFEVPETLGETEEIGKVSASDSDVGDVLTFSIEENELFEITEAGSLSLKAGKALNFEAKPNYEVQVTVVDTKGKAAASTMTITVQDVAEADPEDRAAFLTTWQTDVDGETIYMGLNNKYNYNFIINWGDGNVEEFNLSNPTHIEHVYEITDQYTVAIIGDFPALKMSSLSPNAEENLVLNPATTEGFGLVGIKQWGDIQWQILRNAFYGAHLMEYNASDVPDLSQVTNMAGMFTGASSFNGDLSGWDVSSVTDMFFMFGGASTFNGDLSGWDTSSVINMRAMFQFADAFNGDISGWDVSSVTDMRFMFAHTDLFNGDLSDWDTSSVTNMAGMFTGASAFNGDLSGWDVSSVTDMFVMFAGASSFDQDLGGWNIGSVTEMSNMFDNSGMDSQTSITQTLQGWANFVDANQGPVGINLGLLGHEFCNPSDAKTAIDWLEGAAEWSINGEVYNICL